MQNTIISVKIEGGNIRTIWFDKKHNRAAKEFLSKHAEKVVTAMPIHGEKQDYAHIIDYAYEGKGKFF